MIYGSVENADNETVPLICKDLSRLNAVDAGEMGPDSLDRGIRRAVDESLDHGPA